MTINEYLQNPYGKGSAISGVTQQKEDMQRQFQQLASRFACKIYKYRNEAIFHVVIPSRDRPKVSYDVVFETKLNDMTSSEINVNDVDIKVFSNCPSFIFTFAHAFRSRGLIIPWLDNKYRVEVKKKEAASKNEYGIIGMERSLYLACLYLTKTRRTDIAVINSIASKPTSYNQIAALIRNQDQIMASVRAKVPPSDNQPVTVPVTPVTNRNHGHEGTSSAERMPPISKVKSLDKGVKTKSAAASTSRVKRMKKM